MNPWSATRIPARCDAHHGFVVVGHAESEQSGAAECQARRNGNDCLAGRRVLVVEDEFFLGLLIEETLHSVGCSMLGPFTNLALALQAARQEEFDLAILDINLQGEMVYPLADDLIERGIPFVFLTGYGPTDLPERYRPLPRVHKPYDERALVQGLECIVREPRN
jgi:two-component system, response regulator PdtaR